MHLHKKKKQAESPETSPAESPAATDSPIAAHSHHVAVPEVRTGKVDVDGKFHEKQHDEDRQGVHFDTLAVPEYHTGKCPHYDPEKHKHEHEHKHHGALYDLARIIANGGEEK